MIFGAWRCVLGNARVTYLSGPITTGLRWVAAVEAGRGESARIETIASNSQTLLDTASQVRAATSSIVIEPASLTVRSWSQDDYLKLWTELIERHVGEVRLMDDWAYSNGCAHEFERAVRHDVPTLNLEGKRLTRSEGIEQLDKACARLEKKCQQHPLLKPLLISIGTVANRLR